MSTTTVNEINIDVNALQPAYNNVGLGPIPPGTSVANGVAALEKILIGMLASSWPYAPDTAYVANQTNDGIMEPWTSVVGGTAPSCVVQQIQTSLDGWQLPYSPAAIQQMAIEITTNIANNGGQKGSYFGQTSMGAEKLYWGVAYAAIPVDTNNTQGIIYAFTGALGF
jgi:hypothetical protein